MFGHKDNGNCVHQGWTKTFSVCFTLKDSTGEIWSVKMITNSRSKAGEFEDHWFKLNEIFTRIQLQMELVDSNYKKLMLIQRRDNGHQYHEKVMVMYPHRLVLDDACPWKEVDISNGIMMKCMKLNANVVHDIHLSALGTIAFEFYKQVKDIWKTIELVLVMAGYHPGHYSRFYHIGKEYMNELTKDGV
jgi:hypothetical protein